MNAPTLWEEGRTPAGRLVAAVVVACAVLVGLDLLAFGRLDLAFDLGFVALCVAAALAIHPRDYFPVGVLPPLLLLGVAVVVGVLDRTAVARPTDGPVQGVVSALAHHAVALFVGYVLALAVVLVRQRVAARRRAGWTGGRNQTRVQARPEPVYSKGAGSPAPTRSRTAVPEERSTTVVGSAPQSPESRTASSR